MAFACVNVTLKIKLKDTYFGILRQDTAKLEKLKYLCHICYF